MTNPPAVRITETRTYVLDVPLAPGETPDTIEAHYYLGGFIDSAWEFIETDNTHFETWGRTA